MRRKDLKVGETYLVEDRMGTYEGVLISLDADDYNRAQREVGVYRGMYSTRPGKSHVVVALLPFVEVDGEIEYRSYRYHWSSKDGQWAVTTVTLSQIKQPLDMEEYREIVADRFRRYQDDLARRQEAAEEKRQELEPIVVAANTLLGMEALALVGRSEPGRGVPSWKIEVKDPFSGAEAIARRLAEMNETGLKEGLGGKW